MGHACHVAWGFRALRVVLAGIPLLTFALPGAGVLSIADTNADFRPIGYLMGGGAVTFGVAVAAVTWLATKHSPRQWARDWSMRHRRRAARARVTALEK